jgi:methyl-accepting chemotaxis protein
MSDIKLLERDIEDLKKSDDRLEKRMEKMEEINEAVWKISSNVETIAQQTKEMNVRFSEHIQRIYSKIEKQGEKNSQDLEALKKRVMDIEQKPAKKWETVSMQVITILVAAVVGFIVSQIGFG